MDALSSNPLTKNCRMEIHFSFFSSKYFRMRLSTINERWCLGTTLINSESGFSSIVKDVLFLLRDNYPQVLFPQKSFSLFDEIQLE